MPPIDEVDNDTDRSTDRSTHILTKSPKDYLPETIARTQLLLVFFSF
jgi:hypothetical protein